MSTPPSIQPSDREFLVFCLCAAWCGTCRDYRTVFDALQTRFPAAGFVWVDVEDDADWIGDLDVDNFPTLVVQHHEAVLFQGVLMPQSGIVERLLESLFAGPPKPLVADEAWNLREALRSRPGAD
jgi:thioredoxin